MGKIKTYQDRVDNMRHPQDVHTELERAKNYAAGLKRKSKQAVTFDEKLKFQDMFTDAEGVVRQIRMNMFELENKLARLGAKNILITPAMEVDGRDWRVLVIENTDGEREEIYQFKDGERFLDQEEWPGYKAGDILYKGLPHNLTFLRKKFMEPIEHALETGMDILSLHMALRSPVPTMRNLVAFDF